jgi:hypothetical protein
LCLGKWIDKIKMKIFKTVVIFSDGSVQFSSNIEAVLTNKLVSFQKQDDKNFVLNQKKHKKSVDSKYSSLYKKKYLK